jgi:hypothetical protein
LEPLIDIDIDNQDVRCGIDYKLLYEQLEFKHTIIVEQLKKENERLWEVVLKFASK